MFAANEMHEIWWFKWHRTKNPRCNITEHGFDMVWYGLIMFDWCCRTLQSVGGSFQAGLHTFQVSQKEDLCWMIQWYHFPAEKTHSRLTDLPVVAILSLSTLFTSLHFSEVWFAIHLQPSPASPRLSPTFAYAWKSGSFRQHGESCQWYSEAWLLAGRCHKPMRAKVSNKARREKTAQPMPQPRRSKHSKDHSGGRKKNGVPGKRAVGNLDQHKA